MSREIALTRTAAGAIALVASILTAGIAAAPASAIGVLDGEFGLVENVSALAYPVGVFFAVRLARDTHGLVRAHWILWAVLCVLFFGEETSWLQHWIGYSTPEKLKAINSQQEFNLHNLELLSTRETLMGGGRPSWKLLLSAQTLFYAGFAVYFLLLPLAMRVSALATFGARLGVPRMQASFIVAVWAPIAVSIALTAGYAGDEIRKPLVAETREMLMALAIAFFISMAWRARVGDPSKD